jgi:hypothetical protein
VTRGATLPYTEYEAENAITNGTILGPSTTFNTIAAESSGRKAVQLNSTGQYVSFTAGSAANAIVVRYVIPDAPGGGGITATLSLYINGVFRQTLTLSSKYSWDYKNWSYPYDKNPSDGSPFHMYDEVHAMVGSIPAGASVVLEKTASDTASYYVIDLIDLENVGAAISQPSNSLSVTSYGATGNGSSDDTSAIQTCINDAAAGGNIVWIPAGTYKLSNYLTVPAVSIQGAGMWYTVLHQTSDIDVLRTSLNNASCYIADMELQGEVTNRNDSSSDNGISNHGGSNSVVRDLWIEHTKCGWWVGNSGSTTTNLNVSGCRIRDTYADGINFCNGTNNSTVTNCSFRNTGDDSLASWSPQGSGTNNGNMFNFDTVQNTWRADGFALYGGYNNGIEDNVCSDTLDQSGIMVEQGFTSNSFSGNNNILRDTLTRCGGYFSGNYGALDFWGNDSSLAGSFTVDSIDIESATYEGIEFNAGAGNGASGVTGTNITINSPGNYGIQVLSGVSGSALFSSTTVTSPGTAGSLNSSGSFSLNKGSGDVGW